MKKVKLISIVLGIIICTGLVQKGYSQAGGTVVHDPQNQIWLIQSYTTKKAELLEMIEMKTNTMKTFVQVANILKQVKRSVEQADSIVKNTVEPLVNDYQMVKNIVENADVKHALGLGEYMLGVTLDPRDYVPSFMKGTIVSKYMDDALGWSYWDVNDFSNTYYEADKTSRYSKDVYTKLLPSAEEINFMLDISNDGGTGGMGGFGWENTNDVNKNAQELGNTLDFLDMALMFRPGANNLQDSIELVQLLDSLEMIRYQFTIQQRYTKFLSNEVERRNAKGRMDARRYQEVRVLLDEAFLKLKEQEYHLESMMNRLQQKMAQNAVQVREDLVNTHLMESHDEVFRETDYYARTNSLEMVKILFGEQATSYERSDKYKD